MKASKLVQYIFFLSTSIALYLQGRLFLKVEYEPNFQKSQDDEDCIFRNSSLYRSIYVYPSPTDKDDWKDSILSKWGIENKNNITWPWLEIDERTRREGIAHYDSSNVDFNQYTTELIVREIITHSESCLATKNPETATLFYVPYLPSVEFHNGSLYAKSYKTSPFGKALIDATNGNYSNWETTFGLTSRFWERQNGSDHILVFSEPLHGLSHPRSRRGNYHFIHTQRQTTPPIILSVELSTTFVEMYPNCTRKNILLPYPNTDGRWFNGKFQEKKLSWNVTTSKAVLVEEKALFAEDYTQQRPLAQFYGAGHHGTCKDLRKALSQNYKCTSSAHLSKGLPFMYGYHKATFCPCPGGDSPSAKRNFDALHAGCIPVTLSSDFVWPFTQEVGMSKNPLEFSIRLDAPNYQTALFDHNCVALSAINASNNLQSYFETIPKRKIRMLRHGANIASDQYAYYKRSKDLPDNPLRKGVMPNGGAAFALVEALGERANGKLSAACQQEAREKKPMILDKTRHFKC